MRAVMKWCSTFMILLMVRFDQDQDTLVVIDDSIVRGTTLKESIIRMLSRLKPKRLLLFLLHHRYVIPIVMALI